MCPFADKRHKWRGKHGTSQRDSPKFPSPLSLSCPGVDLYHQIDDKKRRREVKDLKHNVPYQAALREQVEVSRAEHSRIEHLRYQRDTCWREAKMKNFRMGRLANFPQTPTLPLAPQTKEKKQDGAIKKLKPSALLFDNIAHIKMNFDAAWETSPKIRKTFIFAIPLSLSLRGLEGLSTSLPPN